MASLIWIEDNCITCNVCEDTCPDVFKINDIAEVVDNADDLFEDHAEQIIASAEECPSDSIRVVGFNEENPR